MDKNENLKDVVCVNPFYTAEPIRKRVSKQDFAGFIQNYPRRLTVDCCGICDPPLLSYNDFSLANRFPYSVVASTHVYDDDSSGFYYEPEKDRVYTIVSNFEELYDSKTGYVAGKGE